METGGGPTPPGGAGQGGFPGLEQAGRASRLREWHVTVLWRGREGHLGTPAAQSGLGPGHCVDRDEAINQGQITWALRGRA